MEKLCNRLGISIPEYDKASDRFFLLRERPDDHEALNWRVEIEQVHDLPRSPKVKKIPYRVKKEKPAGDSNENEHRSSSSGGRRGRKRRGKGWTPRRPLKKAKEDPSVNDVVEEEVESKKEAEELVSDLEPCENPSRSAEGELINSVTSPLQLYSWTMDTKMETILELWGEFGVNASTDSF